MHVAHERRWNKIMNLKEKDEKKMNMLTQTIVSVVIGAMRQLITYK